MSLTPDETGPVRYPTVKVKLIGADSNAFSIMGLVRRGLREAGVPRDEISKFVDEATSGNYSKLLQTTTRWVNVT